MSCTVAGENRILRSGQTCWRLVQANRFAVIIDAADYFVALKAAMIRARKTIFLTGWDFDLRIHLGPEGRNGCKDWPDKLGSLINLPMQPTSNSPIPSFSIDPFAMHRKLSFQSETDFPSSAL
jgi:hypothetical protein